MAPVLMWVAREPAVTIFSPLITYSSPSGVAVVDTAAELRSNSGSVMAIAAHTLPSRSQLLVGGYRGDGCVTQPLIGQRHVATSPQLASSSVPRRHRCGFSSLLRHRREAKWAPAKLNDSAAPSEQIDQGVEFDRVGMFPSGHYCGLSAHIISQRPDGS